MEDCSTCFFWGRDNADIGGRTWAKCRVSGPETSSRCIDSKRDVWVGSWPWTKSEDWCGEWKQRRQATGAVVGSPMIEG